MDPYCYELSTAQQQYLVCIVSFCRKGRQGKKIKDEPALQKPTLTTNKRDTMPGSP